MTKRYDVAIVGGGHNGLVAAILLAERGLKVVVLEDKSMVGGASKTEYPFRSAPKLGVSSGAYLLGLAPPELLQKLQVDLPLRRRDPHYFIPTTSHRYLLFGKDTEATKAQFLSFFSEQDFRAHQALQEEIGALRDDIAATWLQAPLSIEETAERYVRPALREVFVSLCRGSIADYLERFDFKSDLVKGMYAVTDAFSGLRGGYDSPGTGMNFLIHNMCRLPGADGTWMIVEGGMGTVTRTFAERARALGAEVRTDARVVSIETQDGRASGVVLDGGERIDAEAVVANADPFRTRDLVSKDAFPSELSSKLDGMAHDGATFKVNLCLTGLPKFTCLPEDRGQFGPTIHLLPEEGTVIDSMRQAHQDAMEGRLPEFPFIEWYFHTPIDPSLCDDEGHHNSALFVQWVPYTLSDGQSWDDVESAYVQKLLAICDRFAPGTSDLVKETFTLSPAGIERHFGITRGHIHHIDNRYGFSDRLPYRLGLDGLYSCSAGTHPAGSVIGAAGHNAAQAVLEDLS